MILSHIDLIFGLLVCPRLLPQWDDSRNPLVQLSWAYLTHVMKYPVCFLKVLRSRARLTKSINASDRRYLRFSRESNVLRLWEIRIRAVPWMGLGILCLFWSCMLIIILRVGSCFDITTPFDTQTHNGDCCIWQYRLWYSCLWYLIESLGDAFMRWVTFDALT